MGQGDSAQRGKDFVFLHLASCEVVMKLADNNISSISALATTASRINRYLSVGPPSVKAECFVKSQPKSLVGESTCITKLRKLTTHSTSKHQTMIFLQSMLWITLIYSMRSSITSWHHWLCVH